MEEQNQDPGQLALESAKLKLLANGKSVVPGAETSIEDDEALLKAVANSGLPNVDQFKRKDHYDDGLLPGMNQDEYRAQHQSAWQMWRNSLAQAATGVATDIGKVVGHSLDTSAWDEEIQTGEKDYSNAFTEAMDNIRKSVETNAPVNQTTEAQTEFAPWDSTWWAGNTPSIFSALSFMIPTLGAVRLAGAAGKVAGAGRTFLTTRTGQVAAKGITGAVFSRYNESMFEAGDVYKRVVAEGGTPEQASQAAADSWKANMAAIGPDIFQYTSIAGGFRKINKALKFGAGAGVEGLEEGYQGVVAEEAIGSGLNKYDFFGEGFDQRLADYIQDPHIQTATFFGAIGGGVFQALGEGVNRLYKPKNERLIEEDLARRRAESFGDKDAVSKLNDITFARLAMDHLISGKIASLKDDLETISADPKLDPDVKNSINRYIKDTEFIEEEYDKIAGNKNIPAEAVLPIITTQLEYRQATTSLANLKKKASTLLSDVVQRGEMEGPYQRAKDLFHLLQAYDNLQKKTARSFENVWSSINREFVKEIQLFAENPENEGKSIYSQLVTSGDNTIQKTYDNLVAETERVKLIKSDLATLTSKEGLAKHTKNQQMRLVTSKMLELLNSPNPSIADVRAASAVVENLKNPELTKRIREKLSQLEKEQSSTNKEKTKEVVDKTKAKPKPKQETKPKGESFDPSISVPPERDAPPIDIDVPQGIDPKDLDLIFGPPANISDVVPGMEAMDIPSGLAPTGEQVIIDETGDIVFKRLGEEAPSPTEASITSEQDVKEEQAPIEFGKDNSVKTVLKEIAGKWVNDVFIIEQNPDTTPKMQKYYEASDAKTKLHPYLAHEVFESVDQILEVNTPNVAVGQEVVIRVEPDWRFFKTDRPDDVVMNVYAVDEKGNAKGKPLTQIPSSSKDPQTGKFRKTSTEASRAFRDAINKSGKKEVRTRIVYKNYGDMIALRNPDGSRLQNSIAVLETDMVQGENRWSVSKTPHNPILAYVDAQGIIHTPMVENMNGITESIRERLGGMRRTIDPNEIDKMKGSVGVLRTDAQGSYTYAMLDPRRITEEEANWLKSNLAELVATGQWNIVRELIHVIHEHEFEADLNKYNANERIVVVGEQDVAFKVNTEKAHFWVKINASGKFADNFSNFMKGRNFNFQVIDPSGAKRGTIWRSETISSELLTNIRNTFDTLLTTQFKNIHAGHLNVEGTYIDVFGKEHKNYYEYLKETESISTDLPEGYSFFNGTIYLDPNLDAKREIKEVTKEVIPTPKKEVTQQIIEEKLEIENGTITFSQGTETFVERDIFTIENGKITKGQHKTFFSGEYRDQETSTPIENPVEAYKAIVAANRSDITKTVEAKQAPGSKKIDWDKLDDELDERYRLTSIATGPFKVMGERELSWMQEKFGEEYLSIAQGVDRVISIGGLQAFGYYHNAMIRLAQFAEEGSGYHEAFHFVMLTQYTHAQQEKIIQAAAKKYGKSKNRLQLEEALAEDFRAYMLADGKYIPSVIETKSLFQRILSYIRKALGLKNSIERLFESVANFELTEQAKKNIGLKRDLNAIEGFDDLRHRLIPGFILLNRQLVALNATTHALISKAMADATERASFDDILEVPGNIEKYLGEIRLEYEKALTEVESQMENATEAMPRTELLDLREKFKVLKAILDNWDDKTEGHNKVEGYQSTVIRNLGNYGFQVTAEQPEPAALDADEETEGDETEADDPSQKERIHNVSFFLNNPVRTLSSKVKRFLTTIPEYERDAHGKTRKNADGSPIIAKTMFGTPRFIEFNKVYANLTTKLAGYKNLYGRLTELAENDAIIAAVKDQLDARMSKANQSYDSLPAQFFTTFKKSPYKFITIQTGFDAATTRVIETDRRGLERTIRDEWRDIATTRGIIDLDGKPNVERLTKLLDVVTSNKDKIKEIGYEGMKGVLQDVLTDIGITLPQPVWEKLDKERDKKTVIQKMLFGKGASLETFLKRGVEGSNPFDEEGLLKNLSARSKDFRDDLQAGTFINEKNNQVSAVNLNTPITDLINKLTDADEGRSQIQRYQKDEFYKDNSFLNYLKDESKASKVEVKVFSAFKEGNSEAKEYSDTTVQDSFINRLTAYYNGGVQSSGYISVGTLSDKAQQLFIMLPKNQGRAFLKDVLKHTITQERHRISRLRANLRGKDEKDFSPNEVAAYSKALKFRYVPAINDIPNADKLLSKGELSPEEVVVVEKAIDEAINKFMNDERQAYYDKLVELGLLKRKGSTFLNKDESIPPAIARALTPNLDEFFYNDFAWRLEMSKVFHGDIAFYKDEATYFKRGYQIITPGLQGYVNPEVKAAGHKKFHRVGIVRSSIKRADVGYLTSLAKLIDPKVTEKMISEGLAAKSSKNRAVNIAIQYAEVNKTDAQGYISLEAYRDVLLSVGQWTTDHQFLYDNAWKQGQSIVQATFRASQEIKDYYAKKEGEILLQPLKPFYFGDRLIELEDGSFMMLKEQYKQSFTVLLPHWANKHTQYRELLAAMTRDNLDMVSDSEAVKVGSYGVNEDLSKPFVVRELPAANLRFPFLVPEKSKREILAGTQIEKLIVGNIDPKTTYHLPNGERIEGSELIQRYHGLWADIIKGDLAKFKESLKLNDSLTPSKEGKLQFLKDLRDLLTEELANRSLPDNYLDALKIIEDKLNNPTFQVGLDFPALGKKYEQILTNLFKKKILKQKLPGDSLINLADFGTTTSREAARKKALESIRLVSQDEESGTELFEYELDGKTHQAMDLKMNVEKIINDYFQPKASYSSELSFIRNEDGKIVEAEVGLSFKFFKGLGLKRDVHYDKNNKIIWDALSEEQKKALQFIVYRIPTQGKNSMLPVRATFIMPESVGSIIMLPGEMTKQGGMDFDVDKSYLMRRTHKDRKIENTNENKLFDIHWSILTSTAHAEELLNPLDSKVHDEMIAYLEAKGVISRTSKTSPFSVTTDLEQEKLAKYSKAMIGIFSKFSVAHATIQSIPKDQVSIKTPIEIENPNYKYDQLGRMRDDQGNMISDNHSAMQNSALDAQKDPKLGYLNITTFNANVLAYMTDLGVNQKLALAFLNQPIMRQLADEYFKNGDNSLENAIASTLAANPSLADIVKKADKERLVTITRTNLDAGLTRPVKENLEHQGQILSDFRAYFYAAQDMARVNSALSTDTVRDMTSVAAIQSFIDIVDSVTSPKSSVTLSQDIFRLDKSTVKRVAAFYNYGIKAALDFISNNNFYPYSSPAFNEVRNTIAKENLHRNGKLRNVEAIEQVNQAMTIYMFGEDNRLNEALSRQEYSPAYQVRWNYFDPTKSIAVHLEDMKDTYPHLKRNLFIQALAKEEFERRGRIQMIGINNTHGNFNKTNLKLAWLDLMNDKEPAVRRLAYDLVRFAIQTSGFKMTPTGFVDIIPVEFWRESGLAAYHETLTAAYINDSKTVNPEEASKVIVRHLFANTKLVPSASVQVDDKGKVTSDNITEVETVPNTGHIVKFRAKTDSRLFDKNSERKYARFARVYDRQAKKWRLYENTEENVYKEIQPLGEFNKFVEFTTDGDATSIYPKNLDARPLHYELTEPESVENLEGYQLIGLEEGIASVEVVLGRMKEVITDQSLVKIIDKLLANSNKVKGVSVVVDSDLDPDVAGAYYPTVDTIYIRPDLSTGNLLHATLHEINHAYTVGIIRDPQTPAEKNLVENANRLLKDLKSKSEFKGTYALSNVEELIAELGSNPEFRSKVRNKQPSLWERIIRMLRKALGLPTTNTDLHEQIIDQLYQVLDQAVVLSPMERDASKSAAFLKTAAKHNKKLSAILKEITTMMYKKAKNLQMKGKDYHEIKKEAEALEQLEDTEAVFKFVIAAIKDVKKLSLEIEKAIKTANAAKIREFKEKINSYSVLDKVREHIIKNPADYVNLKRDGDRTLVSGIDDVRGQILTMNTLINDATKDLIAKWIQKNTAETLDLETIKLHLDIADRDVTIVNRGLDAIVDSRDEILRTIGKVVINKKADAYRKSEALLREKWLKVNDEYEKWARSQGININDMKAKNMPILDERSLTEDGVDGVRFVDSHSDKGKAIKALDKNHPLRQYYEMVVEGYFNAQKTIPKYLKPGDRIPSIRRSTLEAFTEEKGLGKLRVIKEGLVETFKRTYDETDRQATDEAGRPIDHVPVRFVSKQDGANGRMNKKEVSYDVASTVFMFIEEMNNHDAMMSIVDELELTKDLLASRKVKETKRLPGFAGILTPDRQVVEDDHGPVTKVGRDSNSYKQAETFINQFVYGKTKKDEGTTLLGVDVAKLADAILKYTGMRMMVGNLNVAFSNVATGEVTMLKEAIGGRFFTMKDWRYGKKMFFKEVIPYAGELGMRDVKSKFGRVFEWLNPEDNSRGNQFIGKDTTRLKKLATTKNLNFTSRIGTLEMNGSLMFTMLNRERLIGPDGKEVGLYEALDTTQGAPRVKEGYTYKGKAFTNEDLNAVRNKIIAVSQKINGIYNTIDSPAIRASAIGRMVLFMRNWLKPGLDARWKLRNFNERLQMQDEGYYVSALNFFHNMFGPKGWFQGNIANLQYVFGVGLNKQDFLTAEEKEKNSPEQNAELTALRRANFKKFLFEMYVIGFLSVVAMVGWDDDDDDSFIRYQIVRLKRELSSFFSPNEAWSTLRQPFVAMDTLKRFGQMTYSMSIGMLTGEAYEEYKQGPNKGEMKIWAHFQNQVPIWAQRNQFVDLDRKADLIERGWK